MITAETARKNVGIKKEQETKALVDKVNNWLEDKVAKTIEAESQRGHSYVAVNMDKFANCDEAVRIIALTLNEAGYKMSRMRNGLLKIMW